MDILDQMYDKLQHVKLFCVPELISEITIVTEKVCRADNQIQNDCCVCLRKESSSNLLDYCKTCRLEVYKRMVCNLYKRKDIPFLSEFSLEEQVVHAVDMYKIYLTQKSENKEAVLQIIH